MLNADCVNQILDGILLTFEEKAPLLRSLTVGTPEGMAVRGTYGSIILGARVTGSVQGKITLILDWDLAGQIAKALTDSKLTELEDIPKQAVEGVFVECLGRIQKKCGGVECGCATDTHRYQCFVCRARRYGDDPSSADSPRRNAGSLPCFQVMGVCHGRRQRGVLRRTALQEI